MQDKIREFLKSRFGEQIIREDDFRDQQSFYVKPEALADIAEALFNSDDLDVKFLADITSVDWFVMSRKKTGVLKSSTICTLSNTSIGSS